MKVLFRIWGLLQLALWCTPSFGQDNPASYNLAFDRAHAILEDWNTAINSRETDQLFDLYAHFVKAYGSSVAKGELIQQKANWLQKHPSYRQEIVPNTLQLVAYELDEAPSRVEARFRKKCMEGGVKTEFDAYLLFELENEEWRIFAESDLTTDRNLAKKAQGIALPNGNYCLLNEVFQDVRGTGLGHSGPIRISYDLSLTLQNGKVIGGYFNYYSGFMRILQEWKILEGQQTALNDLELKIQMLDVAELEPTGPVYSLKIRPLNNDSWQVVADPSKVFEVVEWWNIGCEE